MDKIQGKFYPIQIDEWGRMYTELTKSQIGVLIYVRAIDPYGNGINIKANLIADFLKISRNAVYEAVRVLCEKDYLMAEGVEYTMRLYHKGILNNSNSDSCQSGTQVSFSDDSNIPGLQQLSGDDSSNFQMKNVTPRLKSAPETSSEQEVETLKINKTYTDFKDSLSEEEREFF